MIALLADMAAGIPSGLGTPLHSIACSQSTAVDINPHGSAQIVATSDALPPWS